MGITVEGEAGWYADYSREQFPIEQVYPEFKAAFDKGIKAIRWHQYTPAFNDGEPCVFSVNDYSYTSNPVTAAAWLEQDEPDPEIAYPGQDFGWGLDSESFMAWGDHPDGIEDPKLNFNNGHYNNALHTIFGDNTEVVVTPELVVQFDYDCGY